MIRWIVILKSLCFVSYKALFPFVYFAIWRKRIFFPIKKFSGLVGNVVRCEKKVISYFKTCLPLLFRGRWSDAQRRRNRKTFWKFTGLFKELSVLHKKLPLVSEIIVSFFGFFFVTGEAHTRSRSSHRPSTPSNSTQMEIDSSEGGRTVQFLTQGFAHVLFYIF